MSRLANPEPARRRREHPWERTRRQAFTRWEAALRRVPYGHPVPGVVGFAASIEPPAEWAKAAADQRMFAISALPTGTGSTFLVSLPSKHRRPVDGSLIRIVRPIKRVLAIPGNVTGELLIDARDGVAPASWEETLPGVSPREAAHVAPALSELWQAPPRVVEGLLLALIGSTPWHGRSAGVSVHLEVEGWSLARHRDFLADVVGLAPDWVSNSRRPTGPSGTLELTSGARLRRGVSGGYRPFSIQLRPVSSPPAPAAGEGSPPRSVISYGRSLASEFVSCFAAADLPLLVSAEEMRRVPRAPVELPENLRAIAWGLHWFAPEAPELPDWYRWLDEELPRLREALNGWPVKPPELVAGGGEAMIDRRGFRDRLAQLAIAHARLRGVPEVDLSDLRVVMDAFVRSAGRAGDLAREGRGPLVRLLDRTEGARTTRLRRALESLVQSRPEGISLAEAVTTVGPGVTPLSVENQLEHLRIRGVLYQDRSGRYRIA
jgi:hypothetical protein